MSKSLTTAMGLTAGFIGLVAWIVPSFGQSLANQEDAMARDLTVAQKPIFQVGAQQVAGRTSVDVWVDNPNLTYAIGQPMHLMMRSHQDAYVTIVDVGSSGRVSVLYPNHFQRDARVRAGSTVMIPSERADWQVKVAGPAGVDLIQVIASQKPLTLPELNALVRTREDDPLISLGRSAEDVARDIVAELKPPSPAGGATEQSYAVRNLLLRVVDPGATSAAIRPVGPGSEVTIVAVLPPQAPIPFGLALRTDRPAYRVGEVVSIFVSTRNDCRLTVASVGPNGNVIQLFPNSSQRDNLIRAGQTVQVAPPNSPLQVVARSPAGVEGLIAICREDLTETAGTVDPGVSGFANIGSVQTFGRDLISSASGEAQPQGKIERASTSYIVVE